jgi:Dolichyl-phosphate-mannose-protein mannosyltransferase
MRLGEGVTALGADVRRTLFYAVLAALGLRLIVVAFVYKGFLDPGRDHWEFGYEMGRVARSIVSGHGFANPYWADTGPTALLTPVFPYLLSVVFAIFGVCTKASALVFLALNCLFSALTCLPIFFVARMSFGVRTAKWAAWAWAFFPYAVNFSADAMWYHSLLALLVVLLLWVGLHLESFERIWAWAGFGVLFGFSALTNPVILGTAPFLGGWICYRLARQSKQWTRAATAGALALMVTVAPWLIRNYRTFHIPVFFKDGFWLEVCIGNLGDDLHWWNGSVHPAGSTAEMEDFQRLGELRYMAEKRKLALAFIETHPGTYVARSIRRVVFMWTGFWSIDRKYLRQEPLDPENIVFLSSFTFLSFAGLSKAFRKTAEIAMPYFLFLLSFPDAYYLTHVDPGYRHPLDPLLTILACYALTSWLPSSRMQAPHIEMTKTTTGQISPSLVGAPK